MLVKFETKSQRVKGLSFHSTRPWILASLHSGEIQLWDYRVGTLLEKFEEHEGPVRGIAFHPNQHLFVSGGDDANIFGWNYKTKKKIFHLKGHLDYVRTVFFHHELPWVISTSDDQTVRIWNYLSRNQLTIMTGHTNLVMCAQFHPSKDLIVSCSLDQTVRLWDYTNLRKKYTSSSTAKPQEGAYTGTEVEIKAIMEGHDRGVNWCAFHPTNNLILSTGDDRKVKLWKYNESTGKAWEHDSLYGHSNNVCCAVFHDKLDVLISNSEDRSIKVWDLNKRVCIDTFKKDADRYWVLALHSDLNYLAAGSDSGLTVFTLQSERIPFVVTNNTTDIFYVYKKQLMHRDVKSGRETTITNIDHSSSNPSLKFQKPSSITYNHFNNASHNVLVQFKDQERNYYKYFLYTFNNNVDKGKDSVDSTHRYCIAATFVSKDKLAVLTTGKELGLVENNGNIRNLPNLPPIDMIFPAYMGKIILQNDYIAMLYDTISRKIVNQIEHTDISKLKHVVWNSKFTYVALLCKKTIFILNKNFQLVGTVEEKFKVMSAAWNNDEVLIYTTQNHLKYSIINGDNGILKCIESPFYIVAVKDNEALTIDRDAKVQSVLFDREEYLFKASLFYKDAKRIKFLMENHKQLGNSIISYLYKKNYPAIALNMVKDTRARFSLALDSGNLEVAFRACYDQLKDKECFAKLGEEALRQGNHQIVEISYQNTKAYERLAFLYLVIGNMNKLEMMSQLAQKREDIMGRFHISLFLGDISERIRILAEVGLLHLAYLTAVTHNVGEMVEPLYESIKENLPEFELPETPIALIPPKPIILNPKSTPVALCNWPHHQLEEEDILWSGEAQENEDQPAPVPQQELELNLDTRGNAYEEEPQPVDFNAAHKELESPMDANWGEDIDIIDIPDIVAPAANAGQDTFKDIADSAPGKDPILERARNSQLAGELVACGEFEAALSILKKQIGVVETGPYVRIFEKLHNSSRVKISGLPFTSPVEILLSEDGKKPYVLGNIAQLTGLLRAAYRLTTEGKFAEALVGFQNVLLHIPLLVLKKSQEEEDVYALIRICYHYILAMKCELSKKQYANDPVRCLELSAYMACCSLQAAHRILTLRSAMSLAYKMQDFIYAVFFAKKIIQIAETNPNVTKPEVVDNAKKVYAVCEQKGSNVHTIEFDPTWLNDDNVVTSRLCAKSLKVIKGGEVKRDSFVKAAYSPQFDGQLDEISGVCKIGMECLGLKMH